MPRRRPVCIGRPSSAIADWTKVLKRAAAVMVGTNISETISEVIFAHLMKLNCIENGSELLSLFFCINQL